MQDMQPQGVPQPHDGPDHETRDVPIRGILIFGVLLVLVTVVIQIALGVWIDRYGEKERRTEQSRLPRLADIEGQFPAPRLQGNPGADMRRFRATETTALDTYGWVDRKAGVARIPIDRAITILAEQGLPTAPAPAEASKRDNTP